MHMAAKICAIVDVVAVIETHAQMQWQSKVDNKKEFTILNTYVIKWIDP